MFTNDDFQKNFMKSFMNILYQFHVKIQWKIQQKLEKKIVIIDKMEKNAYLTLTFVSGCTTLRA